MELTTNLNWWSPDFFKSTVSFHILPQQEWTHDLFATVDQASLYGWTLTGTKIYPPWN